ncbi:MAG: hypothetical protein NC251_10715 [Lachnoclostridium sp.]|nr:hypothetical protein [Lachnospira sp.]MCM1248891.1 hypothetical protein [Lachnoclostridium sp.]
MKIEFAINVAEKGHLINQLPTWNELTQILAVLGMLAFVMIVVLKIIFDF